MLARTRRVVVGVRNHKTKNVPEDPDASSILRCSNYHHQGEFQIGKPLISRQLQPEHCTGKNLFQ